MDRMQVRGALIARGVLVFFILFVCAALVLQLRAHTRRIPLRNMPCVPLHDLPRPLKTGDLLLCLHDAHMGVFKSFGSLGHDLASIATLHIGVVWNHPEHGACIVEGVNGSRVGRNLTASTDCAFDALTQQHFQRGVRAVPIRRFLECYEGVVAARLVRDGLRVHERGFDTVMHEWLLKQPFRPDFAGARFYACWGRVVFDHALGLDSMQVDRGGVVCSEVVAVALAAAGLWDMQPDPACLYEDGAAAVKRLVPEAAYFFQLNKDRANADAMLLGHDLLVDLPATSRKQHEHLPMHFASNGDILARAFYGPEIALAKES